MTEPEKEKTQTNSGSMVAAGAVLGVGIGAAVGSATGDMSTGLWVGGVIGVGLGLAWNAFRGR